MKKGMTVHAQRDAYSSPWPMTQLVKMLIWEYTWRLLCQWTPKPLNRWRLFWLKVFGARIYGTPFVHQRARIHMPWNLTLHHRATLGDRTNAYSMDKIEIFEHATVAQEVYLCTGTHALEMEAKNLVTAPITVGANAFIFARAFVMPGVSIGENAVVGACSVVTKDVPSHAKVRGNPAR